MFYRAVGNRCAVSLRELPYKNEDLVLALFEKRGLKLINYDIVATARGCVGISRYRLRARMEECPNVVDCSSFVKWLYGQMGVWLPRLALQQREAGMPTSLDEVVAGDLLFRSGVNDYFLHTPQDGVGHVGIATGEGTVVHAADKSTGVVESPLSLFTNPRVFRGVRRYIPLGTSTVTLQIPYHQEVETSDDLLYLLFTTSQ